MGVVGAGASAELAINLPLLVFWQSSAEAMALARHLGKDPEWLVQLFSETAGRPNVKAGAKAVAATLAGDEGRCAVLSSRQIDRPPSTGILTPVRKALSLEIRNRTAAATSLGWPSRPSGIV